MSRSLCMLVVLALSAELPAQAGDAERGQQLHDQHCMRCHGPEMYLRSSRVVGDFAALRERVQQCELAAELLWFEEDVDDVAAYLNRAYYRFTDTPQK
jgi:mono/diheme cytochrome c family protein